MQLLEHFKELTIHPKNAKELKGLILQLAIQGKLTQKWREQNPNVEPASVLLEKIKEEKAQLIKDKKIKKEKTLPEIAENEILFKLPTSWEIKRIAQISNLKSGTTFNKALELPEGTYKYIKVGAMNLIGNEYEISTSNIYINADSKNRNALIPSNSIIFPKRGGAIATNKKRIVKEPIFVDLNTMALIPSSYIDFYYVKTWFDSIDLWLLNNGTSVPQINNKDIEPLIIPIPPLEEQKAIVSKVNQLFKEVEALETQTQACVQLKEDFVTSALRQLTEASAAQNQNGTSQQWDFLKPHFKTFFTSKEAVKKLRETILQLAVQGKLTTHWRTQNTEVEPASVLLDKIKAEKAQLIKDKKIKKEKPLPEITAEEMPYELPEGWVWCRLGETLLYSDAGKSPNCEKRPVTKNEWGVLTTTAIQQNWFDETANKVLPDKFEINKQQIVETGDILITRAGPINRTGIACKVDKLKYNLILSDKTIRLKYIPEFLYPDCIVQFLNSAEIRALLLNKMIGMASSQVNISQANIKGIPFPLPPLEEQKAIVTKVNNLIALCDQLEQEIAQNTQQVEDLMQSCLKEVFEN